MFCRQTGFGESDKSRATWSSDIVGEGKTQGCERISCVLRTTSSLISSGTSMGTRKKAEQKGPKISFSFFFLGGVFFFCLLRATSMAYGGSNQSCSYWPTPQLTAALDP